MPAEAVTVRDARPEDADRIVGYNAAMARETEDLMPDTSTLREGVVAVLEDPSKGRYFIAEVDGRPVGQTMVTYEWSDWRNGTFLWLQSVYVEPEARRKGVFRTLYGRVQDLAASPGHCGIRLYVHHGNETAREVYRRLGMVHGEYEVFETPDALRA